MSRTESTGQGQEHRLDDQSPPYAHPCRYERLPSSGIMTRRPFTQLGDNLQAPTVGIDRNLSSTFMGTSHSGAVKAFGGRGRDRALREVKERQAMAGDEAGRRSSARSVRSPAASRSRLRGTSGRSTQSRNTRSSRRASQGAPNSRSLGKRQLSASPVRKAKAIGSGSREHDSVLLPIVISPNVVIEPSRRVWPPPT